MRRPTRWQQMHTQTPTESEAGRTKRTTSKKLSQETGWWWETGNSRRRQSDAGTGTVKEHQPHRNRGHRRALDYWLLAAGRTIGKQRSSGAAPKQANETETNRTHLGSKLHHEPFRPA